MLEPRFVLALARLLDESGDPVAAEAEYRRFVDLWTGADEVFSPLLDEARRRLGE